MLTRKPATSFLLDLSLFVRFGLKCFAIIKGPKAFVASVDFKLPRSTSRKLVSPLPLGWSIPAQFTNKSSFASPTWPATSSICFSSWTSRQWIEMRSPCSSFSRDSSWALAGSLHVAITLVCLASKYRHICSPTPRLAPWIRAFLIILKFRLAKDAQK